MDAVLVNWNEATLLEHHCKPPTHAEQKALGQALFPGAQFHCGCGHQWHLVKRSGWDDAGDDIIRICMFLTIILIPVLFFMPYQPNMWWTDGFGATRPY